MWDLPQHSHETYTRNPLDTVVWQLRFHPILRIPEQVARFQETIRGRFPGFQEMEGQAVDVQLQSAGPALNVRRQRGYVFRSHSESCILSLSRDSISLTEQQHRSRSEFLDDVQYSLDALIAIYAPIASTRIGLRYLNRVDRDVVSKELNSAVSWPDLVNDQFFRQPLVQPDDDTRFYSEVTSPMEPGTMTLRYGLVSDGAPNPRFRIDVDRSIENQVDLGTHASQLKTFADDIYSVFRAAAGDALLDWMSGGTDNAN